MTALKNLAFSDVEAPKNTRNSLSTLERAKSKFAKQLDLQIEAITAHIEGNTEFSVPRTAYETDEHGNRVTVTKQSKLRVWWFDYNGKYFVIPKYANKALELQKGKTSIQAGNDLQGVQKVLETLKAALEAGDLDKVLEAQANEARKRMTKK